MYPEIQINQSLHGYVDGHRLISSSINLSKDSERTMLPLSDLSGRSYRSGFEECITGYPLSDDGLYVLSKTWYADEMPRPGCVWTHSLLIDFADLAKIDDLSILKKLFHRPTNDHWQEYKNPIENIFRNTNRASHLICDPSFVKIILQSLYSDVARPVILLKNDYKNTEELIFLIWSQQWPRLRRSFSFCTNAINARAHSKNLLDLQQISRDSEASVRERDENPIILKDIPMEDDSESEDKWVDVLLEDLRENKSSELRQFLNDFGGEHNLGRETFSKLMRAFLVLSKAREISNNSEIYIKISEIFPSKKVASHLKKAITIYPERAPKWFEPHWQAIDVLKIYGNSHLKNNYDLSKDNILHIFQISWDSEKFETLKAICAISRKNKIRKYLLNLIASKISINEIDILSLIDVRDQIIIFEDNPDLLLSESFWISNDISDSVIKASLNKLLLRNNVNWKQLILFSLKAKQECVSLYLLEHVTDIVIEALLEFYQKEKRGKLGEFLRPYEQALHHNLEKVTQWIGINEKNNVEYLLYLYNLYGNYSFQKLASYPALWLPLAKSTLEGVKISDKVDIKTTLLLVAFRIPETVGADLAVVTFFEVHKFIENSTLTSKAKSNLLRYLPSAGFFFDWDLSEKIQRKILDCFIEYNWPLDRLKKLSSNNEINNKIIKIIKSRKKYSDLVPLFKNHKNRKK